jgi:F1F0 ATPase subunit 2
MDLLKLIVSFVIGGALGIVFFGGLWLTVHRIPTTQKPSALIIFSFIIRSMLVMLGFVVLFSWAGQYALVSFIGLFMVRYYMIKKYQPESKSPLGGENNADKS